MTSKPTYNPNADKGLESAPAGHSDGNADEFMHGRGGKSGGRQSSGKFNVTGGDASVPRTENSGSMSQGTGGGSRTGSPSQPKEDQGILKKDEYSGDKEGQEQGPDEEEGYDPPGTHNTPK